MQRFCEGGSCILERGSFSKVPPKKPENASDDAGFFAFLMHAFVAVGGAVVAKCDS